MSSSWEKVNPDNAVDRLPQPYRAISKILEDVLSAVGDHIAELERKRKSEEYEHTLKQVVPTKCIQVAGRVTAAHTEPRGSARVALGTSHGEACLLDMSAQEVVAQVRVFGEEEAVSCISLSADGTYAPRPAPIGKDEASPPPRSPVKLFVAGTTTPRIFVFSVRKEAFGTVLKPACAIHVPNPEGQATAEPRPIVEQMHTRGSLDAFWVLTLSPDRTIRVYLCPLGAPDERHPEGASPTGKVLDRPIMEDEEEENEGGRDAGSDFDSVTQVKVPLYAFKLHTLSPLAVLPEPGLEKLTLTVCLQRLVPQRTRGRGAVAGSLARQMPLICMASSAESNILLGYTIPAPSTPAGANGMDVEALLKQAMPQVGDIKPPTAPMTLKPRRRWELPAEITANAASACGSMFAAGGVRGALALVETAGGLSLRNMLPGHYAAVTALAFHRAEILVSVGADSFVHHYSLQDNTLLVRYLCAPPPSPPPVQGVAVAQLLPVALSLDATGGLRVLDLKRGRKMARAVCQGQSEETLEKSLAARAGEHAVATGADGETEGEEDPQPWVEERPRRVLHSVAGFCVVCEARLEELQAQAQAEREAAGGAVPEGGEENGDADAEGEGEIDRSWLVLFNFTSMLKSLYPSLGPKADRLGEALVEAFTGLPAMESPKEESAVASLPRPTLAKSGSSLAGKSRVSTKGKHVEPKETTGRVAKLTAENLRKIDKPEETQYVPPRPPHR